MPWSSVILLPLSWKHGCTFKLVIPVGYHPLRNSCTCASGNKFKNILSNIGYNCKRIVQQHACPLAGVRFSSVQSLSRVQLCNPMNRSMPGLPDHHQLRSPPNQTHVYLVGDAIQPSYPLSSPSPPAFNLSQHQGLFQWVGSSHHVTKVLELQHQSFQWVFRVDFL